MIKSQARIAAVIGSLVMATAVFAGPVAAGAERIASKTTAHA